MSVEMNLYKRCKNIFKFHGVDMGGGGESAPEVENAIETHGLGWTDTEEKAGFDIQWDGNTEGLEYIYVHGAFLAKVSSDLSLIDTIDDVIGSTILGDFGEGPIEMTITEDNVSTEDNKVFSIEGAVTIAFEDGSIGDFNLSKGIWFMKIDSSMFTNRFYKEATTEEVVHQIDQKYIPGGGGSGGGMVVNFTPTQVDGVFTLLADKTPAEVKSAMLSGAVVGTILFPFATEISPIGCAAMTNDFLIGFCIVGINEHLDMKYMITCDESFTEWVLHQG